MSALVIVRNIWQELSSVERDVTPLVTDFWQLFSHIFGETSLIVTHIWPNHTRFFFSVCYDILFLGTMSTSWSSDTAWWGVGESITEVEE
jgi:hypothetical protein